MQVRIRIAPTLIFIGAVVDHTREKYIVLRILVSFFFSLHGFAGTCSIEAVRIEDVYSFLRVA